MEYSRSTSMTKIYWILQIGQLFVNECVDGSCLEILTDQDLLDMGITSALQRKKLLQWIQIGLKEFTNSCKSHTRNEVTPLMVQTFMEVQQISSPKVEISNQERLPLKMIQDRILQSRHEYDVEIEEKEPLSSPGGRQKQQFILPTPKSQQKITDQDLARQVEHTLYYWNIFAELQMQQIQKPIILSPEKLEQQQSLQESDYHLPQFGTPKFDKQEKKDNQEIKQNNQQQYHLKTINKILIQKKKDYQPKKSQQRRMTKEEIQKMIFNYNNSILFQSINHESVSRTHLCLIYSFQQIQLTFNEKQFYLQDRGNLIGTSLNRSSFTKSLKEWLIMQDCLVFINGMRLIYFVNRKIQNDRIKTWMRLCKSGVQSQIVPLCK